MKGNEMFRQISMSQPDIQADDIALVVQALKSTRLSLGPFLDRFERAFADYVGTEHAVAVSSGTAGLHLCIRAARARTRGRSYHDTVQFRGVDELYSLSSAPNRFSSISMRSP